MSGPKDFTVVFDAARQIQIQARRRAEREARKAATKARQAEQRARAEQRLAESKALRDKLEREAAKRAEKTNDELSKQRIEIARKAEILAQLSDRVRNKRPNALKAEVQDLNPANEVTDNDSGEAAASETLAGVSKAFSAIDKLASVADREAQETVAALSNQIGAIQQPDHQNTDVLGSMSAIHSVATSAYDTAVKRQMDLMKAVEQLMCVQSDLAANSNTANFCRDRVNEWQASANRLIEEHGAGPTSVDMLIRCEQLIAAANQLMSDSEDMAAAFATRNELLQDVIASLQEIGFFVSDPEFENATNPAGPVSIVAVRGGEKITASVDLNEVIRSNWDGVGDEHCKEAFWNYVDSMKSKGVEIVPARADLRDRPQLKTKGERSLPNSHHKQQGK